MSYKPGDTVPLSGTYRVLHNVNHVQQLVRDAMEAHNVSENLNVAGNKVICTAGDHFPPCEGCGPGAYPIFELVTEELLRDAIHVDQHPYFKR
jgi:hypothetical protein